MAKMTKSVKVSKAKSKGSSKGFAAFLKKSSKKK
jgi:hypothetical protein